MDDLARLRRFLELRGLRPPSWVCLVFARSNAELATVQQMIRDWLQAAAKPFRLLPPCTYEDALERVLTVDSAGGGVLWLSALYSDLDPADNKEPAFGASIHVPWQHFFLRLNERRQLLLRDLHGGLVLSVPPELQGLVPTLAPDLWSIRGLVLDFSTGSRPDFPTGSRPDLSTGSHPDLSTGSHPDLAALSELHALFRSLFTVDELRRFVVELSGDHELRDRLPPAEAVSFYTYAEALVELLLREGRIDHELFSRLVAHSPRRVHAIDPVARRFHVELPRPADPPPPPISESRTMPTNHHYLSRPADAAFRQALHGAVTGSGGTVILAGPPKCGKQTLWNRAQPLHGMEAQLITIDMLPLAADKSTEPEFYQNFGDELLHELGSTDKLEFHGSNLSQQFTTYVERALQAHSSRVVLLLPNVDRLLTLEYGEKFFITLRHWHARRSAKKGWSALTTVLMSSLPPSLFIIKTPNTSPFNFAATVLLGDFTRDECGALWQLHGVKPDPKGIDQLHRLTAGHPLLTTTILHALAAGELQADDLGADSHRDRIFEAYLGALFGKIEHDRSLRDAFQRILRDKPVDDLDVARTLYLEGVLREEHHRFKPRCALIRDYFRHNWRLG